MTQRDSLTDSLEHLEYEMAMIIAAWRMRYQHPLPEPNTARPHGYYWANDQAVAYLAGMESVLTHARLLDDFFRCTTSTKPTRRKAAADRYAFEYCDENAWTGFKMLTEDQHERIDKQLSHFTTLRGPRKNHALDHYGRKAIDALTQLTQQAQPQWQPPLKDILAKAQAEQQRFQEPWDPTS
jgi:hypothetical protein